jgi:hypothetical protein
MNFEPHKLALSQFPRNIAKPSNSQSSDRERVDEAITERGLEIPVAHYRRRK